MTKRKAGLDSYAKPVGAGITLSNGVLASNLDYRLWIYKSAVPGRITFLAPNRSFSRPVNGAKSAAVKFCNVKANEIAARPA
jgi:hypothetical protein